MFSLVVINISVVAMLAFGTLFYVCVTSDEVDKKA
jgi:hypothetical protein